MTAETPWPNWRLQVVRPSDRERLFVFREPTVELLGLQVA